MRISQSCIPQNATGFPPGLFDVHLLVVSIIDLLLDVLVYLGRNVVLVQHLVVLSFGSFDG